MKALHLKSNLAGASVAAVLLSFTACDLLWPDREKPEHSESNVTIMTNSSDPQLLSAISKEGHIVDVFGSRNSQGLAENINQIIVSDKVDKNIYWLDDKRRPTQVITDNGTVFLLEWLTDAKIALTVNSNDGESQINTEIDLSNGGQINGKLNYGNVDINRNVRRGKKLALTSKSITQNLNHTPSVGNKSHNTGTTVDLHVTKCNIPSDAKVWINAHTAYPESKYLTTIFPTRISTGMYTASIPYGTAPSVNPAELCKSIESILGGICQTQIGTPILGDAICMAISAVIAATPLSPATAAGFLAACESFSKKMMVYCSTLGASPVEGAPSMSKNFCEALPDHRIFEDIFLTAIADGLPNDIHSQSVKVEDNDMYAKILLDLGTKSTIQNIALTPSIPQAFEPYQAVANISCLPVGTQINYTVQGTDGYYDQIGEFITGDKPTGEYILVVPGAEGGVQDTITMEVVMPGGETIKRTATLAFSN